MVAKIQQIVRETLEEKFPKLKIARIGVSEHTDDDGDAIIEIQVVFEGGEKDFDPAQLRELPRLIMPKLEKMDERGFPLFSFISKSDFGKRKTEAA